MPTVTFLNLPIEKQNIIMEASIREFGRVLLKDASINKIIKDANISRGSFYNYFLDINDLYVYSLNNYRDKFFSLFKSALCDTNGDLFRTTEIIYDRILIFCSDSINKNIIKNIFLNMNYNISIRNKIDCENIDGKYELIEILKSVDKSNLNLKSDEELFYIIDMIIGFVIHGLIDIFLNGKDSFIVKEKINIQLEILKRGIYKEDK